MNKMKCDFNIQTSPREWPEHANGVLVKSSKLLSSIFIILSHCFKVYTQPHRHSIRYHGTSL